MEGLIKKLYYNELISHLFHTLLYCLKQELKECQSVLDLGCGPDSPVKYCNLEYSVGVDAFKLYIQESKKKKIHNKYLLKDITKTDFKPKSFDAVIMIDVLEHLEKKQGEKLLEKAEKWAKKKVIVSAPVGFLPQASIDDNPFQSHRSGWAVEEMEKLGYKAHGMAGWKFLRRGSTLEEGYQEGDIFATIRFSPKIFWLIISELTQAIIYYFPKLAFEAFYVKNL
ncbi:class I SAM-dependent methyltransferase [Patescibacteria group bacterium]|nr:class I SAM-dependent methyltransferase [Patescibacteria group bacterium]